MCIPVSTLQTPAIIFKISSKKKEEQKKVHCVVYLLKGVGRHNMKSCRAVPLDADFWDDTGKNYM